LKLKLKNKVQNNPIRVILSFDGWMNILKQNILELVFIILKGKVLIWKTKDINNERERKEEVMDKIK